MCFFTNYFVSSNHKKIDRKWIDQKDLISYIVIQDLVDQNLYSCGNKIKNNNPKGTKHKSQLICLGVIDGMRCWNKPITRNIILLEKEITRDYKIDSHIVKTKVLL